MPACALALSNAVVFPCVRCATQTRQSSAFGSGAWSGRGISDPRPIREKGFINDSMKVLIEYLCEHQYEHPISLKILKRPSSKDVNNILQFLFRQIDPRFKVQAARAEDDVAKMFGTLRYPFKVSKSALQAAGAEHTWPALLGAITWLIELLKYDEEVTTGEGGIDTEAADKVFFDYLSRAYGAFLSAEDEVFEELETELRENFGTLPARKALLECWQPCPPRARRSPLLLLR